MYSRPHMETTQFKDVYSPSGFDLLNVLVSYLVNVSAQTQNN